MKNLTAWKRDGGNCLVDDEMICPVTEDESLSLMKGFACKQG